MGFLLIATQPSETQIRRTIVIAFATLVFVSASAAFFGISRIQNEIQDNADFHADAYASLLRLEGYGNNAIQELFAYLLSGLEEELVDFYQYSEQFRAESIQFSALADLNQAGEEQELEHYKRIQSSWTALQVAAGMAVRSYQDSGNAPDITDLEIHIDAYHDAINELAALEALEELGYRETRRRIIRESQDYLLIETLITVLGLLVIGWFILRSVMRYARGIRDRDEQLALSATALEATNLGICFVLASEDNPMVYVNDALLEMTGYARDELIGQNCRMLQGPETDPEQAMTMRQAIEEKRDVHAVVRNYRKTGEIFWNELFIAPVREADGRVTHFVGTMNDVTERIELEEQLLQAQKHEAIGLVAGSVAHDFNNFLTVINGNAEMLEATTTDENVREFANQILGAGKRSAELTRHLLAFSRRQVMVPKTLDLNQLVTEMEPLLRSTLRGDISLEIITTARLGLVSVDQSQIEQVLLNLVVNARDALAGGGSITIETGNVLLDPEYASRVPEAAEGRHVMLAVCDTGEGIPKDVGERIFAPFFTTRKDAGRSGLGLSTVLGIVKQSGGNIQVYSEEGEGTKIKVYLPRVGGVAESARELVLEDGCELSGMVLIVEDEARVRDTTGQMLRSLGLSVVSVPDAEHALDVLEREGARIDILLTDVMLPGMSGRVLAGRVSREYGHICVLYMTGYMENNVIRHGRLDDGIQLIEKPFTIDALRRKLTAVMSSKAERPNLRSV
jgi:PAS domain S-box-containing protein